MIGTTINNRYEIKKALGQGGMGTIYLANDRLLKRNVAVKVVESQLLDTVGRANLLSEARAVARLNHPNIVTLYDAGDTNFGAYIVLELIEGPTLHEKPPTNLDEILEIAIQICNALEHAHQQGIIHRDIKPENVAYVSPATKMIKLMDFGLAQNLASRLSKEGDAFSGTVFYVSPEQAIGDHVDCRSDLYSLGVMLYEMTTGELPFSANNPIAVITQHLHAPVIPPHAKNSSILPALDQLILRLLSKSPSDRPDSAAETRQILENIDDAVDLPPTSYSTLERIVRGRLVGRETEFASARMLWDKALTKEGQFLLVSGEPGIGKTRLVRELATLVEVSGKQVYLGECYAESSIPYIPFAHIFRKALQKDEWASFNLPDFILADLLAIAPDLRLYYPDIHPNPPLDPTAEAQRLFENVVLFFTRLSERSPVLIIVEDLHWGDAGSLNLLQHLARRTRHLPVMLVATYREVELDRSQPVYNVLSTLNQERLVNRIKLTRLDKAGTRNLLETIFSETITDEFLHSIYQETEGNPFFVEEVCKALVESGKIVFSEGHWKHPKVADLEIPQSIKVTIQSRIEKLSEEGQQILSLAAIIGREFHYDVLRAACNLDDDTLINALENSEQAQIIKEISSNHGGKFTFAHALIPHTLAEELSGLRRRRLHRQIATALEALRKEDYETLAYHYSRAETLDKAIHYLTLAGDRARKSYANQEAVRFYSEALEMIDAQDPRLFDLLAARARVYNLMAKREAQKSDVETMLKLAKQEDNDHRWFQALLALSDYYLGTQFNEAEKYAAKALELAKKLDDPELQGEALYRLGYSKLDDGITSPAKKLLIEAISHFKNANRPTAIVRSLSILSIAYSRLGEHRETKQTIETALELSREIGERREEATLLRRLAIYHMTQGDFKTALPSAEAALAIHQELGDRLEECHSLNVLGQINSQLGAYAIAKQHFDLGLSVASAIRSQLAVSYLVFGTSAFYFRPQGDLEGEKDFLDAWLDNTRQMNDPLSEEAVLNQLINLLLESGQYTDAVAPAEKIIGLLKNRNASANHMANAQATLARVHAYLGNVSEANELLKTSLAAVNNLDNQENATNVFFEAAYVAWLNQDPTACREALPLAEKVVALHRKHENMFALSYAIDMVGRLHLLLDNPEMALKAAVEAVQIGEKHTSGGMRQFLLTLALAQAATGANKDAAHTAQLAYEKMMAAAENIQDPVLRKNWLENAPENRLIITTHTRTKN